MTNSDTDLALDTRSGLPEDLRILARRYPPELWRGHANFDQMTAFWLDRHAMFRDLSGKLVTLCQTQLDTPRDRFLPDMSRYASFFLEQLHSHHTIEDQHYFPQLVSLDGRIAHGFDLLDADHHALDACMNGLVDAANTTIRAQATSVTVDAMLQAQERLQAFLDRHLADEEEIVIPLILEYGPTMR